MTYTCPQQSQHKSLRHPLILLRRTFLRPATITPELDFDRRHTLPCTPHRRSGSQATRLRSKQLLRYIGRAIKTALAVTQVHVLRRRAVQARSSSPRRCLSTATCVDPLGRISIGRNRPNRLLLPPTQAVPKTEIVPKAGTRSNGPHIVTEQSTRGTNNIGGSIMAAVDCRLPDCIANEIALHYTSIDHSSRTNGSGSHEKWPTTTTPTLTRGCTSSHEQ